MGKPLRILIASDSAEDAANIAQVLQASFASIHFERASGMDDLRREAENPGWDLVVCDACSFDIREVLRLSGQTGFSVLFVSDDDAQAVLSASRAGAKNIVIKSRLMDLAESAQCLLEERLTPNESAFFDTLHKTAEQIGKKTGFVECADPALGIGSRIGFGASPPVRGAFWNQDADMHPDRFLLRILEKAASCTGGDFVDSLLENLGRALKVKCIFAGTLAEGDPNRIAVFSAWAQGRAESFEYDLRNAPCRKVLSGTDCYHPAHVQSLFPECEILKKWDAESYFALPLLDSGKNTVGLLAIIADAPLPQIDQLHPVLKIFASCIATELDHRRAKAELTELKAEFRIHFDLVSVGMSHIGLDGKWLKINPKLCEMFECGEDELCGKSFYALIHPEELPRMLGLQTKLLMGTLPSFSHELRFRKPDGSILWAGLTVSVQRDAMNRPIHLIAAVEDLTQKRRTEEQLRYFANHDALTRLPNRKFLLEKLEQELARAERSRSRLALLLLDLDRFKLINDSLGYASGDSLMTHCGERILRCIEEGDFSASLGSDEFAILCSRAESNEAIASFCEKLLTAISAQTRMEETDVSVTACIGIAVYPEDGDDISTLLLKADTAMYRAKDSGGNHYRFYSGDMPVGGLDRLKLENDLRHALERGELILHYQPQVDLATGEMVAIEALLRWNHPEKGIVSPAEFIQLAEETGLIAPIGEWVLRTACRQAKAWQGIGGRKLRIAVNLSARQFQKQDLVRTVSDVLHESGLDPEFLELEITESIVMHSAEESIRTLNRLKEIGVRISIDDFGTGYSSLSYLKEFPVDKIKIDQSFVENITSSPDNAALANGIISLAHSIKLSVTAEGVENLGQLSLLSLSKCDSIQGFYFCNPLPAESLQKLIEQGKSLDLDQPDRASKLH